MKCSKWCVERGAGAGVINAKPGKIREGGSRLAPGSLRGKACRKKREADRQEGHRIISGVDLDPYLVSGSVARSFIF